MFLFIIYQSGQTTATKVGVLSSPAGRTTVRQPWFSHRKTKHMQTQQRVDYPEWRTGPGPDRLFRIWAPLLIPVFQHRLWSSHDVSEECRLKQSFRKDWFLLYVVYHCICSGSESFSLALRPTETSSTKPCLQQTASSRQTTTVIQSTNLAAGEKALFQREDTDEREEIKKEDKVDPLVNHQGLLSSSSYSPLNYR